MLSERLITAISEHAARCYPNECCGLIIRAGRRREYVPCENGHAEPGEHFRLSAEDYASAEDAGTVLAVVHSHPDGGPHASADDMRGCHESGLPWVIITWPASEIITLTPEDMPPMVGRPFIHGSWDCYGLVRDWYFQERGIQLPDYERTDGWWERGENLYVRNYVSAGFISVSGEPETGDVILMQYQGAEINHAGIYLGDGKLLHHIYGKPSAIVPYGGVWRERTMLILRYNNVTGSS